MVKQPPIGASAPSPRVDVDEAAAVLLVDLEASTVVDANPAATVLADDGPLPIAVDAWSARVGLVDAAGHDLAGLGGPFSRIVAGEHVAGEMVHRGSGDSLWMTGFPLRSGGSAVVVLMPLRMSPHPEVDDEERTRDLHNRAVMATDLSFTISDPRRDDDPLVWVNPAFERTTGYTADQAVGRNCRFLQGEGTDREAVRRLGDALRSGRPVVETLLNYRADGTAFWNEVSISPVHDAHGAVVNFVGVQADVTARVAAEAQRAAAHVAERRARARLALLADIAGVGLDLESPAALRQLAELLARGFAGWCAVVVAENGTARLAAMGGAETTVEPRLFRIPRSGPDASPDPVADLIAGAGHAPLDLERSFSFADTTASRWLVDLLRAATPGQCVAVPVTGRHEVLGLLVVGPAEGALDPEDLALLTESARRVGLALDNARLYAREHMLAEALQRSMLPEQSSVPHLDVWSYYAPNLDHAQVGGDWYDVMQPDAESVGIVIGDVVGHDIEAAAAMGQLRSVVRAYAFEQEEPGTVLMRVDQLVHGMRIPRSASLVYARLTQLGDDHWEMAWSRAGHLPPLVVSRGEVRTLSENGGTLVGFGDRPRATNITEIGPGDVVVFYTDGLIERRSRPMLDGLRALQKVCGSLAPTDAAGVGEQLLTALGDAPEDDMAIVVVRVPTEQAPEAGLTVPRQRRWQLPAEPTSIGRARRLTVQTAALWDLDVGAEAELVVSELVANAVLHGWGPVGLRLRHDLRGLVVEVDDSNPAPPARAEARREGPGGYGLHVVERLAEWGWHSAGTGKTVWARILGPAED